MTVKDCPEDRVCPVDGTVMKALCARAEAAKADKTKEDFILYELVGYRVRRKS